MDMRDMNHILNILTLSEKSERISIVLGPNAGDAELLAAHALKERLGEKSTIVNAPDHLQDRWSNMFKKERVEKESVLAFDTETNPVDELRYEKNNGKLRIFLSTRYPISKNAIELEEQYPLSDMIIALGFSTKEELENLVQTELPLRNPEALINLSAPTTQAKIPDAATAPDIRQWNVSTMKLWGRALLRSYLENGSDIFWAFLPKEDFEKTGETDDMLPDLIADMRRTTNLPHTVLLLWQSPRDASARVRILVSSTNAAFLNRVAHAAGTQPTGETLVIEDFQNFSEAEVEMRKILKHIA